MLAAFLVWSACTPSLDSQLAELRSLQDGERFEESVTLARTLLGEHPAEPEVSYRLGLALASTGRGSMAMAHLQRAAGSEAVGREAGLLLASLALQQQNFELAVDSASGVFARTPDEVRALALRAQARLELAQYEEAIADADQLLALDPGSYPGRAQRAQALHALGRAEEAEAAFRELETRSTADAAPEWALRACLGLATFHADREETDAAIAKIERCLLEHPGNPTALRHGVELLDRLEQPERATALLAEALELAPERLDVRMALALRLAANGEEGQAEALLREGAELGAGPNAWANLARFQRQRGDPEAALASFGRAQAVADAIDAEWLDFERAEVLVDLGRLEQATALVSGLPDPAQRDLIRGRIHFEEGRPDEALALLGRAIERWPSHAGARFAAATAALEVGDLERARSELREAHRLTPGETDAALTLARLSLAAGDPATAVQFAQRHASHRGVTGPEAHQIVARAYALLGQPELSRAALASLAKAGFAGAAAVEAAQIVRTERGAKAAAASLAEGLPGLDAPGGLLAFQTLVLLLLESGDGEAAAARVAAELAERPADPDLHSLAASVSANRGSSAEARVGFARALELDPEHAPTHGALGNLELSGGRPEVALAHLERARTGDPDEVVYAYLAARAQWALGRTDEAEASLRRLLRRWPDHAPACNDLAYLLAEEGQALDLALDLAQRAMRLTPSPEIEDTLAWVLFRRGELGAAVEALQGIIARAPSFAAAHYHLALVLMAQDDAAGARAALRAALATGVLVEAEEARAELSRLEAAEAELR